jgi:hypothetical protein
MHRVLSLFLARALRSRSDATAPSLTLATLLACAVLSVTPAFATPIIEYAFNEGSGNVALNTGSGGVAQDGAIQGASYSTDTPSGSGTSLSFDGVNDVVLTAASSFQYGSALTIEAWIKPSALTGFRVLWDDYGNPGVLLALSGDQLQFNVSTPTNPGPGASVISPTRLSINQWTHVRAVYDGSGLRLYINGTDTGVFTAASGAVIENGIFPAAIGADSATTTALNYAGLIDDFRVSLVPEPSIALLLAAWGVAFGWRRRAILARIAPLGGA